MSKTLASGMLSRPDALFDDRRPLPALPSSALCWFLGAPFGDVLASVDEPGDTENLHGWAFERDEPDGLVYTFTGRRSEWVRPPTFRSRAERTGQKRPPLDTSLDCELDCEPHAQTPGRRSDAPAGISRTRCADAHPLMHSPGV